jgi:hypothetical protein
MQPTRVLLVANRTAADEPLTDAVRRRARQGEVVLHLVVPATPSGLHRVVDPEVAGREIAAERLARALPVLAEAAGQEVTGHVGDANPLCAVQDALNLQGFDEIILSTHPWPVSRWLKVDLPRKLRALNVPVLHVQQSPPAPLALDLSLPSRAEFDPQPRAGVPRYPLSPADIGGEGVAGALSPRQGAWTRRAAARRG